MDEIYIEHSNGISKSTCYCTLNFLCGSNVEIPDIQRIAKSMLYLKHTNPVATNSWFWPNFIEMCGFNE